MEIDKKNHIAFWFNLKKNVPGIYMSNISKYHYIQIVITIVLLQIMYTKTLQVNIEFPIV